jgi:hypothetical protein
VLFKDLENSSIFFVSKRTFIILVDFLRIDEFFELKSAELETFVQGRI